MTADYMKSHSKLLIQSHFTLCVVKMKYFVFISILIAIAYGEINKRECIEKAYAGGQRSQICENIFANFTAEFTSSIVERLKPDDDQACFLRLFDFYGLNNLYLKGLISHMHNGTEHSAEYEDDVDGSIDAVLKSVKVLCISDEKYGTEFNESIASHQTAGKEKVDPHTMSCLKKYMFENGVLDPAEFNINVSTLTETNCDTIWKNLDESLSTTSGGVGPNTFFGLSAEKAQECTTTRFKDEKVFAKIFSFHVVVDFDLTINQINQLREKYIQWNSLGVKILLECTRQI